MSPFRTFLGWYARAWFILLTHLVAFLLGAAVMLATTVGVLTRTLPGYAAALDKAL